MAKIKARVLQEISVGGSQFFDYKKPNQKIEGEYAGERQIKDKFQKGGMKTVHDLVLNDGSNLSFNENGLGALDLLWKAKNLKIGRKLVIEYKGPQHPKTKEFWNGKGDFDKWAQKAKPGHSKAFKVFSRIAILK